MFYATALRLMGRPAWARPAPGPDPLRDVAADVAARHPQVAHLSPAEVAARLLEFPRHTIVFDVREPYEYAVSHIGGAHLMPPGATVDAVRQAFAAAWRQPPSAGLAIFYCAVGVRSSALASRCQVALSSDIKLANLAGGVFRWSNEARSLTSATGATTAVHPYNRHWSRFLATGPGKN
jgi:rhodanese-related sulfurtransferase